MKLNVRTPLAIVAIFATFVSGVAVSSVERHSFAQRYDGTAPNILCPGRDPISGFDLSTLGVIWPEESIRRMALDFCRTYQLMTLNYDDKTTIWHRWYWNKIAPIYFDFTMETAAGASQTCKPGTIIRVSQARNGSTCVGQLLKSYYGCGNHTRPAELDFDVAILETAGIKINEKSLTQEPDNFGYGGQWLSKPDCVFTKFRAQTFGTPTTLCGRDQPYDGAVQLTTDLLNSDIALLETVETEPGRPGLNPNAWKIVTFPYENGQKWGNRTYGLTRISGCQHQEVDERTTLGIIKDTVAEAINTCMTDPVKSPSLYEVLADLPKVCLRVSMKYDWRPQMRNGRMCPDNDKVDKPSAFRGTCPKKQAGTV